MELSKIQSVYERDGWLLRDWFPALPAGLQRRAAVTALGKEWMNNRSCELVALGLPRLSGRSEHPSPAAHNSEGSEGCLWRVEIARG